MHLDPHFSFHFLQPFPLSLYLSIYLSVFPCRLFASAFPSPFSCSSLSLAAVLGSERHRYLPPVSQRQLTAAGRSPVPSCTAADKDPTNVRTPTETPESRPVSWLPGGSRLHRSCAGAAILHSSGSMTVVHELSRVSWLCVAALSPLLSLSHCLFPYTHAPSRSSCGLRRSSGALAFSPHRGPYCMSFPPSTDSVHVPLFPFFSSFWPLSTPRERSFPRTSSRIRSVLSL